MLKGLKRSLLVALMLGLPAASVPAAFASPLPAPQQSAAQDTLYKRLGGYDALAAVTDDFLNRLATDPKEGRFFVGLSTDSKIKVRQHIVDFLCVATGGPCKYTGRDMATAHTGLGITEEDWTITVKHLGETLNKFNVPADLQQQVVGAIAPLKSQIVGR
jgi:hemoglobin